MNKIYAFTDEYGAFGWDLDNPSVSTNFIISAIIVKETDVKILQTEINKIRE